MKPSKNDLIFTAIMLLIIYLLSNALYDNYNHRLQAKINSEPLGSVTYKHHKVKRKYSNRFVWEYVYPETPIYIYDSILTEEKSDATIRFKDGTLIDIGPNSMVVIDFIDNAMGMKLEKGSIQATGNRSGKNMLIQTNDGNRVDISQGSVQLTQTKDGLQMAVRQGQIELIQQGKHASSSQTLDEGSIVDVDPDGKLNKSKATILSNQPQDGVILETSDDKRDVNFAWGNQPEANQYRIHVSTSPSLSNKKTYTSRKNEATIPLPQGIWFWQVESISQDGSESSFSQVNSVRIARSQKPIIFHPGDGSKVTIENNTDKINFNWKSPEENTPVDFVLAKDAKLENVIERQVTQNSNVPVSGLTEGRYYWTANPSYGDKTITRDSKEIYSFDVVQENPQLDSEDQTQDEQQGIAQKDNQTDKLNDKTNKEHIAKLDREKRQRDRELAKRRAKADSKKIKPITNLSPNANSPVFWTEEDKPLAVTFRWKMVPSAKSYTWRLFSLQNGKRKLVSSKTLGQNHYTYSGFVFSPINHYSWEVECTGNETDPANNGHFGNAELSIVSKPKPPNITSIEVRDAPPE